MEVLRLTSPRPAPNLNSMRRFIFAAVSSLVLGNSAVAQDVAGRDLFEFPLGLLADAPALSTRMSAGLWNPAASALSGPNRASFGFAGLTTPKEQGVGLQMIGGEYRVRPALTASLSFAQASVSDILRTTTDPIAVGGEIAYGTMLASAGMAETLGNLSLGAATRYRWSQLDTQHTGAFSFDVGGILDHVAGTPVRVAASTFLLSPQRGETATYLGAADVPLIPHDSLLSLRGGYSVDYTNGRGAGQYIFTSATYRQLDGSLGFDYSTAFGNVSERFRIGFGLRYAGYSVAVGREDGGAGVGANYQFLFTRVIR